MRLDIYAHISTLLTISSFVFLICYLLMYKSYNYLIILGLSLIISELIIHLFLQIRVVQSH